MAFPKITILKKNFKNIILGEFVKIRKFTLVILFVIHPKNNFFEARNGILKFLGMETILRPLNDHTFLFRQD